MQNSRVACRRSLRIAVVKLSVANFDVIISHSSAWVRASGELRPLGSQAIQGGRVLHLRRLSGAGDAEGVCTRHGGRCSCACACALSRAYTIQLTALHRMHGSRRDREQKHVLTSCVARFARSCWRGDSKRPFLSTSFCRGRRRTGLCFSVVCALG